MNILEQCHKERKAKCVFGSHYCNVIDVQSAQFLGEDAGFEP